MIPNTKKITICLIGDPPSERFHSMGIYERAISERLARLNGIKLIRHQWPASDSQSKNRYLEIFRGYWNRHLRYPSLLRLPQADLYHILDQSYAHLSAKLPLGRVIITCHDIMPLMMEGYDNSLGGKISQASFRYSTSYLLKARHIISDSNATQKALIDILGLDSKNITVVPLGVDEIFFQSDKTTGFNKPNKSKYILQVGATIEPYKNTMNILRSFSLFLKNSKGHIKLLKVGKPYTREQQSYIEKEGLAPYIRYLGFVEREKLPGVYCQAAVLLMPSLYEGFGMPLLEAMACGVPVVTSELGSIPEVAGDAALYVDPKDPKDISIGLERVLSDITLRQDLISKGLLRVKTFTWDKTARETFTVYKKTTHTI